MGINVFKNSYQHRTNILKNEEGDLVTYPHSILARWRQHFSQLLNVDGVNDVRQTEIHTAEPLVPEPRAFEVEMAIEKLKSHKSPGIDQVPAKLIKARGQMICHEIHKLINSICKKEESLEELKESIIVLTKRRAIQQTAVIIQAYHFCQLHTKFYPTTCCQG